MITQAQAMDAVMKTILDGLNEHPDVFDASQETGDDSNVILINIIKNVDGEDRDIYAELHVSLA